MIFQGFQLHMRRYVVSTVILHLYILDLAKFYIEVDNGREDKLKTFESFSKKDPSSFLFAMAIGGDAAPGTGMAILISFLNAGERLPSSKE